MVIMSVDYGAARTGLAVCDKFEMLASPVTTVKEYNRQKLIKRICEEAERLHAELIVVGLPKNMDGSEGAGAENCRILAEEIHNESGTETFLWDERCTTVVASNLLNNVDVRGKKRKQIVDSVAATLILESYLTYRKNNPERKK